MMTQYNDITRFFAILFFLFLFSCQSEPVDRQRNGNDRFKTSAPSLIYFKNIRSLKYLNDRNPRTQMDYYRHKTFTKKDNKPLIFPVIIHNWLEDESYLIYEKKNIKKEVKIRSVSSVGDTLPIAWPETDYLEQLDFVVMLKDHLGSDKEILIEVPGTEIITLNYSSSEKNAFIATIQDFINLTETASSRAKK